MSFYSIILPAFNESSRIGPSLEKALAFVREQHWKVEIIVVNDGSRDDTAEIVKHYMQNAPELRLLENPGNRGKGYSVRNGMLNARGDILLFSDTDFSSPIQESLKLITAIETRSRRCLRLTLAACGDANAAPVIAAPVRRPSVQLAAASAARFALQGYPVRL